MVLGTIFRPKFLSFPSKIGNKSKLQIDFVQIAILQYLTMVLMRFGCLGGARIADKDIILAIAKGPCAKPASKTPNVMTRMVKKCFSYIPIMVFGTRSGPKVMSFP